MNIDFFNIVVGVQLGDILALYLFILSLDNRLRTSIDLIKENGFTLRKVRNIRYLAEIMTDADNADNLTLLTNTPA